MGKVANEFQWLNITNFRPLSYYTEFHKLSELGSRTARYLELVKVELTKGVLIPRHFTESRSSFIQTLYCLLSILRTYGKVIFPRGEEEEVEERKVTNPIFQLTKDIELLVKYLTSHDVAVAVNNVSIGRTGEMHNIIGTMESILNGLVFASIEEMNNRIIDSCPRIFIEETLKRAGVIPKFKEEKPKEVSPGI